MTKKIETQEREYPIPETDRAILANYLSKYKKKEIELNTISDMFQEEVARVRAEQDVPDDHNTLDTATWKFTINQPPKIDGRALEAHQMAVKQ